MNFLRRIVKPQNKEDEIFYYELKKLLNFKPVKLSHYKKAFTHRSLKLVDKKGRPINYERLEFLGDAILGSVMASYLYKKAPEGDEGYLTQMRSKVVSREHLNTLGKDLNLIRFVKSNIAPEHISNNLYGNIFEALIGAIYLDRGYNYCLEFIYKEVVLPYVNIERLEGKISSYKGYVIEWCQKNKKKYKFESFEDSGNQAKKHFSVTLHINDKVTGKGRATSKKKAEEIAAKRAYFAMQTQMEKS
ncbi:ribonuclease III [Tenacibaculum finnmarkense genomovar finnmarkense]|uniref:Ribonuclease 3 n=1 Tax=Tenacibaculum finnmarkense genomovar finnmarkense TaxID=1458503 RepID=A0AAP1RDK8_9FLAO|nr:ribonuclease III [Tenacibaculum finnmarkense]MBE7652102.1 ribonuclease III [Tenacibaculum finnmarkense genomovar finnmarkense]MBE7659638.1 ribonuclease III [Tenacibaculum finnmarkense genomovar finnmarkense]MBE7694183.1 ribonuclease III [Tenacibaculum finnmarkense genomovar finnmarkense]MCD8401652.1 ribonuclease III [Tenacibaculum finnmarkense genomovar finnmarkense]MCD8413136.1 ribonuclease III [Tenacibaculum finnmarkense genomovar ulcerans]